MTDMSPRPLSKLLEQSQFAFLDISFLLSTCLGACFLSFVYFYVYLGMMGHTSQLVSCCIFTAHLIDNDVREWPLCTTSLGSTRKYIHVFLCQCITSYRLFGNGINWTTYNCRSFFRGGTFLEGRVTYGGVDSGAICKEPVQAMVSHHHPQSLSWKITLKYGKRSSCRLCDNL